MKSLKNDRFEMNLSRKLGFGNFADVYLALDKMTGNQVAIKVIAMNKIRQYGEKLEKAIEKEITVLKMLTQFDNPYLLRFVDCFDTENNKYLVLEFCNGGTLGDILKKRKVLPEQEALEFGYQIVLGLSALEESGISHRDIKPDNVFIHDSICKIGDFGFASHESKFTSSLGTCVYMAPEFYVGRGSMNSKVDVWAFGVTLHQVLFQDFPFDGNSQPEVIQAVVNKVYNPPSHPQLSAPTCDLLRKCLHKDPDRRISFKELRTHPAFTPYMPKTQNRLGNDVKVSLFNNGPTNIYQQVNQQGIKNGYIKPEAPPQYLEDNKEIKNKFIGKVLVEYRNAYTFFGEISTDLEQVKDCHLASFFLQKRALQRAAILLYYLKEENQPPEHVLHDTNNSEWRDFTKSEYFDNFLPYLIYDVIQMRSVFEKKFIVLRDLYLGYDQRYEKLINDDLQENIRDVVQVFTKETVGRLVTGPNANGVDLSVKMMIMNEIDRLDSRCSYLENLREKVERVLANETAKKRKLAENYISK